MSKFLSRREVRAKLAPLRISGGVRKAKVQAVRDAIDSGKYLNGRMLSIALDRLIADVGRRRKAA